MAIDPVARRMDEAKWDKARAMTLSGAGLSTAIVFLITQIGVNSCALSVSFFCASIAIPAWLALWQVGEAYSFFGPEASGHFSTLKGSGTGLLLFTASSLLLLVSLGTLIGHFSLLSAVAFVLGSGCMVVFVYKHRISVQAWVAEHDPHNDA
ncbi:hypothetical protein, partial [Dyella sp.]|uniref:hypothetical protein n=1 Tax=Dyella sp. TaxID=1869338 RepID=UPI002D78CFE0